MKKHQGNKDSITYDPANMLQVHRLGNDNSLIRLALKQFKRFSKRSFGSESSFIEECLSQTAKNAPTNFPSKYVQFQNQRNSRASKALTNGTPHNIKLSLSLSTHPSFAGVINKAFSTEKEDSVLNLVSRNKALNDSKLSAFQGMYHYSTPEDLNFNTEEELSEEPVIRPISGIALPNLGNFNEHILPYFAPSVPNIVEIPLLQPLPVIRAPFELSNPEVTSVYTSDSIKLTVTSPKQIKLERKPFVHKKRKLAPQKLEVISVKDLEIEINKEESPLQKKKELENILQISNYQENFSDGRRSSNTLGSRTRFPSRRASFSTSPTVLIDAIRLQTIFLTLSEPFLPIIGDKKQVPFPLINYPCTLNLEERNPKEPVSIKEQKRYIAAEGSSYWMNCIKRLLKSENMFDLEPGYNRILKQTMGIEEFAPIECGFKPKAIHHNAILLTRQVVAELQFEHLA